MSRKVTPLSVGTGTLSAILTSSTDPWGAVPLHVVHVPQLHWTVGRRHAVWGILTQLAVIGFAAGWLWLNGGCG